MADVRAQVVTEFKATGVEEVRRSLRLVTADAGHAGEANEKLARGARAVASGLEEIARTGEAGGRSLKEMVAGAAELAMSFGAGGPITVALGIGALAVVRYFQHAREQIEETRQKFEDELKRMVNAGDNAALLKQAQDIYRGTPAGGFKDGLKTAEEELAAAEAKLAATRQQIRTADFTQGKALRAALFAQIETVNSARQHAEELRSKFEEIRQAILDVNNTPLQIRGLLAVKVSAMDPNARGGKEREEFDNIVNDRIGGPITTESILDILFPRNPFAKVKAPDVTPFVKAGEDAIARMKDPLLRAAVDLQIKLSEQMREGIANSIAKGIGDGLRAAIASGNILAGFKALAKSILAGLGEVIMSLGEKALAAAILANTALKAIFTPTGIAASLALIALGASLQALGGSGGGGGGGYGGGGGSVSSSLPSIIDRGTIDPSGINRAAAVSPRTPQTFQFTVIGENDPRAQRSIVRLIQNAGQRNL